jgi:uncharacterized protein
MSDVQLKFEKVQKYFRGKSVFVAFSGGTDSSALLICLKNAPEVKLTAVTINGCHIPKSEFENAKNFCRQLGIKHLIIETNPLDIKDLKRNDERRCYVCKRRLFSIVKKVAANLDADIIADATNLSDKSDFRPGMKALQELDILSPFLKFEITKEEILEYLRSNNFISAIHPSNACLISRVPYGIELSEEILARIDEAESYIKSLDFSLVRCRYHLDLARIEVPLSDLPLLLENREKIVPKLNEIGFKYVTLDLRGYRTGGAN